MTRGELARRIGDVAAASAAVLADGWAGLAAAGERERYELLRRHVEAALVAFLEVPGPAVVIFPAGRGRPTPSRNRPQGDDTGPGPPGPQPHEGER